MGLPRPVLAAIAVGVVLVGLGVYIGLAFLGGDTDRDGRVPVPGSAVLELEPGEVDLFYAEDIDLGDTGSLSPPRDLAVRVAAVGGAPLEIRLRSGQEVSGGGGTATLIGSIDVVDAGPYEVATQSAGAVSRSVPEVTLGVSPFDLIGDRLGEVLDLIFGPAGLIVLIVLLLLGAVALVRARSSERGPTLPPGYGGSAE
jgi:hypothetical protein